VSRAHAARARVRTVSRRRFRELPRRDAATLLVMFYGSAIAVLVVSAGVVALLTEGITSGTDLIANGEIPQETGLEVSPTSPASAASPAAASPADITIAAEHLGDQRVGIEAQVTMNEQRRPLAQAQLEAYLDMVEMPGAHTQGPLALQPAGQPGVYTTVTTVPMLGDYEIRVEMHNPVRAEAEEVVSVGVIGPGQ
jgi:hypothetical protein